MFFFTLCYKTCGFALNNYVTYEESITKFTNFTFVTLNYTRYITYMTKDLWFGLKELCYLCKLIYRGYQHFKCNAMVHSEICQHV